jgi:ABC-type sugar transport system ATPase subunit
MAAMTEHASASPGGGLLGTMPDGRPAIELRGITKRFPGIIANNDITLDIFAGEIHVLLGENGAGKSTLISILAGLQQPDAGTICVRGQPIKIGSPRESLDLGIGTVFQHVQLVPSLTVLENLMLGGSSWRPLHRRPALKRFRELSELFGSSGTRIASFLTSAAAAGVAAPTAIVPRSISDTIAASSSLPLARRRRIRLRWTDTSR